MEVRPGVKHEMMPEAAPETRPLEIRALVLDFDGVVLESNDIKTEAFLALFQEYPEHLDAIAAYHRRHVGMSRYRKFAWIYETLLGKPLSPADLAELGARYSALVFEKILQAPFVPGAQAALERLHGLGVPVFVASGTPQEELDRIVERRGLGRCFAGVWGSPTEKTEALRAVRASRGVAPGEMLFVGDGLLDYEAAAREGVPFLARALSDSGVDWDAAAVPNTPDLTPLAELGLRRRVTIPARRKGVPALTLTVAPQP